ncbi:MAG: LamG domain-containing protein [Reichenbachiella sp.]
MAYLVENPLPIEFIIVADQVAQLEIEVISTLKYDPEDLGYTSLPIEFVETFDFLISTFSANKLDFVESTLTVYVDDIILFEQELGDSINVVTLNKDHSEYKLVISLDTEEFQSSTLSLDSLITHRVTPLNFIFGYIDLTLGLQSYYPFNGNSNDESTYDSHGTLGPDTSAPTLVADKDDNASSAYYFDGTNDYIDFGEAEKHDLGKYEEFSLSFWAKPEGTVTELRGDIFSKYVSPSDNRIYAFAIRPNNEISASFYDNGNTINTLKLDQAVETEWHHYLWTLSEQTISLYIDGEFTKSDTMDFNLMTNGTANSVIGAAHFSDALYDLNYNGSVDELRIYNRVLNTNEISKLAE